MDDLVQWLRAQLAEDERIARAAQRQHGGGEWAARADASGIVTVEGLPDRPGEPIPVVLHPDEDETAVHVAEHDPARVLRETDAKRQIIEQHERYAAERRRMMGGWDPQSDDSPILAALASVYADRPAYREEWRP